VIFYSATYRVPDARRMASACDAAAVLPKPSDPEVIIAAVRAALGEAPPVEASGASTRGGNSSLAALVDFQCALAEERDPDAVLELACRAAPNLVAAQCAVLGLESAATGLLDRVLASGIDPAAAFAAGTRVSDAFGRVLDRPGARALWSADAAPLSMGFPPLHPPLHSLLVAPLQGVNARHGWIYLANRRGGAAFGPGDAELLELLARQAAVAYENDLLARQAMRDGLTGLLNRRELDSALAREFQRAVRQRGPLVLVMADVDHFKRCNDRNGHAGGDAVLRAVAAVFEKAVRGYDQVFRFGGEEFALLFPGATIEDAVMRAEQIRHGVRALDLAHDGKAIGPITISLGVAGFPVHADRPDALLRAADRALYGAKLGGRDRTCAATSTGGS